MIRIRHLLPFLCVALASATEPTSGNDKEKGAKIDDKSADLPAVQLDGRPVLVANGWVVRHPEGVEFPPKDFEAALEGRKPLAVIKTDGKIIAEVYGNWSTRDAKEKADGVGAGAEKNPLMTLLRRNSTEKTRIARGSGRVIIDPSLPYMVAVRGLFAEDDTIQYSGKEEGEGMNEEYHASTLEALLVRNPDERPKQAHEVTTVRMGTPNKLGTPWIKHTLYFEQLGLTFTFEVVAAETDFNRALPLFETMFFAEEKKAPTPETRSTEHLLSPDTQETK